MSSASDDKIAQRFGRRIEKLEQTVADLQASVETAIQMACDARNQTSQLVKVALGNRHADGGDSDATRRLNGLPARGGRPPGHRTG